MHVSFVGVGPARDQTVVLPRAPCMSDAVLVVGVGGREHALAWGLARSSDWSTRSSRARQPRHGVARASAVPVDVQDPAAIAALADASTPTWSSSGPRCRSSRAWSTRSGRAGRLAFGPSAAAARLEGSKAWMKEVLAAAGVPTARVRDVRPPTRRRPRSPSSRRCPAFYVVKTDGLAAGKGVVVTESLADARDAVRAYLSGAAFGDAGRTLVIEEGLTGPEVSLLVLCDGSRSRVPLAPAQDFKRDRRRRRRAEHRRHGCVLAGAVRRARTSIDEVMAKRGRADARRAANARHRVPRRALRRADAHARRARR